MIRWHFMEIYTRMEPFKCSLSSCDWLKQLMNITLGFVPPALWLHVNPSLPLHVHQGGLCPPCHELSNWVFKPYSNNSKRSSKSAIPSFGLLSLNTRSIYILISVLFFFCGFQREEKLWFRRNPLCIPNGNRLLTPTFTRVGWSRLCWWRQQKSLCLKWLWVCQCWQNGARKAMAKQSSG